MFLNRSRARIEKNVRGEKEELVKNQVRAPFWNTGFMMKHAERNMPDRGEITDNLMHKKTDFFPAFNFTDLFQFQRMA